MSRNLTTKQRLFVDGYVTHGNASQAALDAGYTAKNAGTLGYQLLQNPLIAAEVEKRVKNLEVKGIITKDMVIEGLLKEAQSYGEGTSHSARVNAWTQLGKHLAMFTDKLDVKGNITQEVQSISELMDSFKE